LLRYYNKETAKKKGIKNPKPIRYYACGEYGDITLRPHYHIILFNLIDNRDIEKSWKNTKTKTPLGIVHIGTSNVKTIAYTTKYIMKQYSANSKDPFKPFSLMSKGIGANYLKKNAKYHLQNRELTVQINGKTQALPEYYKKKIFKSKILKDAVKKINMEKFKHLQIQEETRIQNLNQPSIGQYQQCQTEHRIQQINKTLKSKTI